MLGLSRVVLIPGGYLGLLPLHAARISAADAAPRYVIDAVDVTHALSGRAAFAARQELHARGSRADYLCGVGNPQVGEERQQAADVEGVSFAPLLRETGEFKRSSKATTVGNVVRALPRARTSTSRVTAVRTGRARCIPSWSWETS